jgi:hypothetical protein
MIATLATSKKSLKKLIQSERASHQHTIHWKSLTTPLVSGWMKHFGMQRFFSPNFFDKTEVVVIVHNMI